MSIRQSMLSSLIAAALFGGGYSATVLALSPSVQDDRLSWPVDTELRHQLRLVAPDGSISVHDFAAGQAVELQRPQQAGQYRFELIELPVLGAEQIAAAKAARERGDTAGGTVDPVSHNGGFLVDADAGIASGGGSEAPVHPRDDAQDAPRSTRDQVIPDDLIVQASLCVGFDCIDNEVFSFDTLRLKENNTRIGFHDTSFGDFPARHWEITANESQIGGLNFLGFTDIGTGNRPFWVQADARNNALVVVDNRVGFGTSTPEMEAHYVAGDTPAQRLEQSIASGYPAQIWDIAGNEANFFIRDVTGGNPLPFRIRPGAATSSLDIHSNGIGMGISDPEAKLHIVAASGFTDPLLRVDTADGTQMQLEANGNLRVNGTISQLSSRAAKTGFIDIDADAVLDAVASLPIAFWSYLHQDTGIRHLGPTAEDFHAAFGLGERPTEIATGDLAGVALAAIQALNREVAEKDQRIEDLEARLQRLEARLIDSAGTR